MCANISCNCCSCPARYSWLSQFQFLCRSFSPKSLVCSNWNILRYSCCTCDRHFKEALSKPLQVSASPSHVWQLVCFHVDICAFCEPNQQTSRTLPESRNRLGFVRRPDFASWNGNFPEIQPNTKNQASNIQIFAHWRHGGILLDNSYPHTPWLRNTLNAYT